MDEQRIEEMGMQLANRAYLYRLFQIVFGAEPTGDVLKALATQEATDALSLIGRCAIEGEEKAEATTGEATTCAAAEVLAALQTLMETHAAKADDTAYIEALKADYSRLFLTPGTSYVHPWESPYVGTESMLFQESTLDVRHRLRAFGYEPQMLGSFPDDHLALMLDFLAHLSSRAFEAFGDGEDETLKHILTAQQEFIAEHLLNWLPLFCEKLQEKDAAGVYLTYAQALVVFLEGDKRFIVEFA